MRVFDIGGDGRPLEVHDRVLTVPNVLTFLRFLALPLVWLDLAAGRLGRAFALIVVLGLTDWFDGYLARRLDQLSRLGKFLDPVGDRALLVVVGVGMVRAGLIPGWAIGVLLAREVLMVLAGLVVLGRGRTLPETSRLGKASTMGIMIALPLFVAGALAEAGGSATLAEVVRGAAWVTFVPNVVLAYAAAAGYARGLLAAPAREDGEPGGGG